MNPRKFFSGLLLCLLASSASAQVSFTGADYTQSFDGLAATGGTIPWSNNVTLPGWFLFDRNGVALTAYSTANSNSGTFMSLGGSSASDRALGSTALLGGGAAIGAPACYSAVALTNNTGHDIATFNLNYTGEQWRVGTSTVANTTFLEYGFGATYAGVTTWTRPAAATFHFTSPITTNGGVALALDGNAAANSVANLGGDVSANWAAGTTLWVRWVDINDAGNDHALAVDNLKVHEGPGAGSGGGGGDTTPLEGYTPFTILQDSWTSATTVALQGANPELRTVGGANAKELVLKTNVTGVLGSVTSAKLRLYITGSQAGTKTQIYAANNNWSEGALDWNTRPGRTTLLAEVNNPDPATANSLNRFVDFDVTNYISGTGTYSFIVKSDSTSDVVFQSREGTNAPRLEVKYVTSGSAGEHNRFVTAVLAVAEDYKSRYASADDIANIGIFDVTKQPYGADPTGQTDSTLAIQRAVNEARDARVVAYFPAGTYLVSDTLNMVQGRVDYQVLSSLGERWNNREFSNNVMGPVSGPRAKLILPANAAGFTNAALPKKLIYFWSRGDNNANENQMNIGFNQTLQNLDVDLNGNAGAIGIDFSTAQGSSVYDLTVYATGAFAGFNGTPGPGGSLTGVTVIGGKYGLYITNVPGYSAVQHAHSTHVNACNLLNQTDNSIVWTGLGTMSIVGTRIEGRGITNSGNSPTAGNLTIIDSVIRLTGDTAAVTGTRSVHMDNVYLENASIVADLTSVAPVAANPGGWAWVKEYAGGVSQRQSGEWDTFRAAQTPPLSTHGISVVPGFVDGVRFETPIATVSPSSAAQVPADLQSRHAWRAAPSWNDADVINVKTWSGPHATGDNNTDDLAALQAAVDAAAATGRKVFLPKGDYRVTGTLQVRANTTLFGVNKNYSIIKSRNTAPAFSDAGNPSPIMATDDDTQATTYLTEFTLLQRMGDAGTYLLNWRAGKGEVKNVNFDRRNQGSGGIVMGFPLVRLEGNGGGRWYNFWNESSSFQGVGYRQILVSGTTQLLGFYMLDPEADVDGIFNAEFIGVRNVSTYGNKMEGLHNTTIRVSNSRNVRFFGFGGNAHPDAGEDRFLIENSEDVLFAMGFNQQATPSASFSVDPNLYNQLREVRAGEADTAIAGWQQFTLYRRGQPGTTAPGATVAVSTASAPAFTPVTFTATVQGPGPFAYQWLKNGAPIVGATGSSLVLPAALVADSGDYSVSVSNDFGTGVSAPVALAIVKAPASVALGALAQTYDGTSRAATATTAPSGLSVSLSYDGTATDPINAGSYAVTATIADANYFGSASGTLVVAKAAAALAFSNLTQTYDGTARTVGLATTPAGLVTQVTYDGGSAAPINVGSYAIAASVSDANYEGSATATLTIQQAAAQITLSGLAQTYDGTPRVVAATTVPAGLTVQFSYDGGASAPTGAGSYAVSATIADANYSGSASDTLVVAKAAATIAFSNLTQTYDGIARTVDVATSPAGLVTQVTYDGNSAAPVGAGTYAVAAQIDDANHTGSAAAMLTIQKALAPVTLSGLAQTYDGTPRLVAATTMPAGLTVQVTYDGSATAPTDAGSYAIAATVADANYQGSATGTLIVARQAVTITLAGLTQAYDGTPRVVTATTDPSGVPVAITYDGSTTAPTNPGSYAIAATTTDANHSGSVTDTLTVATTAFVRRAPSLNGGLDGSLQVMQAGDFALNGDAWVSSDILVPGTPEVRLNGHPVYAGTLDGSGASQPDTYRITLNGNAAVRHVVRRTDPPAMPTVSAPPAPTGTRDVSVNRAGQSLGAFATLRNLSVNGNAGDYTLPAGTYGEISLNGTSGLVLGVAGSTSPSLYQVQRLTLGGNGRIRAAGPIVIVVANGVSLNGGVSVQADAGATVLVVVAAGDVSLNGAADVHAEVVAPNSLLSLNGTSTLTGRIHASTLTVGGAALLKDPASTP